MFACFNMKFLRSYSYNRHLHALGMYVIFYDININEPAFMFGVGYRAMLKCSCFHTFYLLWISWRTIRGGANNLLLECCICSVNSSNNQSQEYT